MKKQTEKPPRTSAMATSGGKPTLLAKQVEEENTPISEKSNETKKLKGNKPGDKSSIPAKEYADANKVDDKAGTALTTDTIIEVNTTSSDIEEVKQKDNQSNSPTPKELHESEGKDWLSPERFFKARYQARRRAREVLEKLIIESIREVHVALRQATRQDDPCVARAEEEHRINMDGEYLHRYVEMAGHYRDERFAMGDTLLTRTWRYNSLDIENVQAMRYEEFHIEKRELEEGIDYGSDLEEIAREWTHWQTDVNFSNFGLEFRAMDYSIQAANSWIPKQSLLRECYHAAKHKDGYYIRRRIEYYNSMVDKSSTKRTFIRKHMREENGGFKSETAKMVERQLLKAVLPSLVRNMIDSETDRKREKKKDRNILTTDHVWDSNKLVMLRKMRALEMISIYQKFLIN